MKSVVSIATTTKTKTLAFPRDMRLITLVLMRTPSHHLSARPNCCAHVCDSHHYRRLLPGLAGLTTQPRPASDECICIVTQVNDCETRLLGLSLSGRKA